MIKRIVQVVQVVALLCAIVFVVALFANEPTDPTTATSSSPTTTAEADGGDGGDVAPAAPDGAEIFSGRCASCHGANADGGFGPKLSDGRVVEQFPEVADQLEVVRDGRGGMPAFGDRLTQDELDAVVAYTRSL